MNNDIYAHMIIYNINITVKIQLQVMTDKKQEQKVLKKQTKMKAISAIRLTQIQIQMPKEKIEPHIQER